MPCVLELEARQVLSVVLRYAGKHASILARWDGGKREWWRRFGNCQYAAKLELWERLDSLVSLVGIFYVKTWCYRCLRWCEGGFTSGTSLSDLARCDGWRPIRGRVRKIEIF